MALKGNTVLKRTLATFVLLAGLTGLAHAEDAKGGPTDDCMKSAYDLADDAEKRQLPDATLEKLDGMFNTMEKHCKSLELPQAQAMAKQIKSVIETEK